MKKGILFIYFIFFFANSHAADWDLFPLNQKSFYQYKNAFQVIVVDEILLDSILVSGTTTTSFFLRNYQGLAHGNCYSQLIDFEPYPQVPAQGEMDSLLQMNDTVFFPGYHKVLYFIPGASVGQTWNSHDSLGSSGFTDLHITCASIQTESFLGIVDSVKTFSFSGYNGNVHYSSGFDTVLIKLSKNYGLIQYLPFKNIRDHYLNSYLQYHYLTGIHSTTTSVGFNTPPFSRFIPYHPGDILNWQYVGACSTCNPPVIIYSRDSITQVNFDPDTFSYHYWRWSAQDTSPVYLDTNMITKYSVADLTNIFESPTNWISIAVDIFGIGSAFNSRYEIYNSDSYRIDVSGNDTTINYAFRLFGFSLDTSTCYVYDTPDATFTLYANTRQGVTQTCYDSFGQMCTYLIGSIILGDTVGYTDLAVGTSEINHKNRISIYPNPASSTFTIHSTSPIQSSNLEIHNLLGEKIFSAVFDHELLTVDCRLFPPGIYFVSLQTENGISVQKLIKQ